MKIKNRLAFYYMIVTSVTLFIIMVVMYIAFQRFFKLDFYTHLNDRAHIAAQLYLEADEISSDSVQILHNRMISALPDEVIRIYDSRNMASFIKDRGQYWGENIIELVRKKRHYMFDEGKMSTVGIYYHDNQGDFVILASAHDASGHRRLRGILEIMFVVFILVNATLFFTGRWFARRTLKPIDRLIDQIRQIRASKLDIRVDEGSRTDEIGELAVSFNKLLEHLQNTFELQQTFLANASHELRTPITSMTGEIEVLRLKDRPIEEYKVALDSLQVDIGRLADTTQNLMNLAQIDMDYTRASREPVRVDELIWELEAHWAQQKIKHGPLIIRMNQLPEDQQELIIYGSTNLLKIAFNNIISNAFKYSDNKPVILELKTESGDLIVEIVDEGIGVPEDEIADLLKPFYRSRRSRKYQGSGIGLFIANKIITLYDGAIDISLNALAGSCFTIRFPKDRRFISFKAATPDER